jgi:CheY-like chemotaxis protein
MAASAPHQPVRILIVDDHVDSARALSRLFRHEGYGVVTAHTVAGALALLAGQPPVQFVVSDVGLPDGDGCELLERLRAFYGGRDLPAIAMSGLGDAALVERCRRAGYRLFLMKPLTFEQVIDAVRAVDIRPGAPPVSSYAIATPPAGAHLPADRPMPLGGVPAPLPAE